MGATTISPMISARYAAALASNVQPLAVRAEVWSPSRLLATFRPVAPTAVSCDRSNAIRRIASIALAGGVLDDGVTSVVPSTAASLFTPMGNEIRLYRGIAYNDGSGDVELVPQGLFDMEDVVINETSANLLVTLNGNDRAKKIARAGLINPVVVKPRTPVGAAIQQLLSSVPVNFSLGFDFDTISFLTPNAPLVYTEGQDPWTSAQQLAAAAGCELFFRRDNGNCRLRAVPDQRRTAPAYRYDEGQTNLATEMKRTLSRKTAPNYIIRIGQGSGLAAPVRAVAIDNDPSSPTYIGGPYGQQVDRQTSALYSTLAQAQAAANAALLLAIGSLEVLDLKAIVKPDHDVDDVIEVTRARAGINSNRYVLDAYRLGFTSADVLEITQARSVTPL